MDKSRLVVVHLTKGNEGNHKGPYESKNLASLDVESCHKCYKQSKGTQDSLGNKSVNFLLLLSMRLFVTLCTKRHAIYSLPIMIGSKY